MSLKSIYGQATIASLVALVVMIVSYLTMGSQNEFVQLASFIFRSLVVISCSLGVWYYATLKNWGGVLWETFWLILFLALIFSSVK